MLKQRGRSTELETETENPIGGKGERKTRRETNRNTDGGEKEDTDGQRKTRAESKRGRNTETVQIDMRIQIDTPMNRTKEKRQTN